MISILLYSSLEHEKAFQKQLRGQDALCLIVSKDLRGEERKRKRGRGEGEREQGEGEIRGRNQEAKKEREGVTNEGRRREKRESKVGKKGE